LEIKNIDNIENNDIIISENNNNNNLINSDNNNNNNNIIETKLNQIIYQMNNFESLKNSSKEEDIFERLKRENENQLKFEKPDTPDNDNYGEPELLTSEEKKQILNMPEQKIRAFIQDHSVSDLTPLQRKQYSKIIGSSKRYLRLEQELGDNELYKLILSEEIDKMFEPTNSERVMYKEMYGENLNVEPQKFTTGTTFGGSQPTIVQKQGHSQSGGNESTDISTYASELIEVSEPSELTELTESTEPSEGETKVIKI
jgi:hypothetical protein